MAHTGRGGPKTARPKWVGPGRPRGAHKGLAHKSPGEATRARPARAQGEPQGPGPLGPRGAHKRPAHKSPGEPTRARPQGPSERDVYIYIHICILLCFFLAILIVAGSTHREWHQLKNASAYARAAAEAMEKE